MASYNNIIELHLSGDDIYTIHEKTNSPIATIKSALFEFRRYQEETITDKVMQVKSIESELFLRIEKEKFTGKKDKSIDSLKQVYSTYLIN